MQIALRPYISLQAVRWTMAAAVMAVALGGCAETQLITHTAKRISKTPSDDGYGVYKVGNPYQIAGVWYYPREDYSYVETGIASWYGPNFHGKNTANGEVYDMNDLTAAHRTLPMPSFVQVTNLENGRSLKLRINDRGPFAHGRIIDVSRRGAQLLGFERKGTARVRVEVLEAESRTIAQQLKGGTQLAQADLPIRSNIQVGKPQVSASTLPPPPGAVRSAVETTESAPPPAAAPAMEREVAALPGLDGRVSYGEPENTNLYIQAGAFIRYDNAHRVQARLQPLGEVAVTSVMVDGNEFFRVRAGPIMSVETADRLLEQVIRAGYQDARIVVD